jgi:phosphatidylglycerol:prolipoprotein diacylglycerol transferase
MHRILFRIPLPFPPGHFDIASYGVMVALGALVGVLAGVLRAKKSGENPANVLDLALWVLIAGLIGSRINFLITVLDWTGESKSFLNVIKVFFQFRQGGLVFYGGLLLAIPTGIAYLRIKKLNVWRYADIAAPSVALGIAFARIGCYLNGCCWGRICSESFPFHVVFPKGSLPPATHINVPLIPSQFISSLNALILSLLLAFVYRRKKFEGQVFSLFGALYSLTRFLIEFLRDDTPSDFLGVFTQAQAVSLFLFPASLVLYFVLRARGSGETVSASAGKSNEDRGRVAQASPR